MNFKFASHGQTGIPLNDGKCHHCGNTLLLRYCDKCGSRPLLPPKQLRKGWSYHALAAAIILAVLVLACFLLPKASTKEAIAIQNNESSNYHPAAAVVDHETMNLLDYSVLNELDLPDGVKIIEVSAADMTKAEYISRYIVDGKKQNHKRIHIYFYNPGDAPRSDLPKHRTSWSSSEGFRFN